MKKIVIIAAIIIVVLFIVLIVVMALNDDENNVSNAGGKLAAFSQSDTEVMIDFSACPATGVAKITMGSSADALELIGKDGDNCLMQYGADPDDPDWGGSYAKNCQVPIRLGQVTFSKQESGIDYRPIREYCSANDNSNTICSDINDEEECKSQSGCLTVDYCTCTTDFNRAEKCGYSIPGDEQCLCDMGGFERCEDLHCPAARSACDEDFCSNYTYSDCPTLCQKECQPSDCHGDVCTNDCDGAGSCYCSN